MALGHAVVNPFSPKAVQWLLHNTLRRPLGGKRENNTLENGPRHPWRTPLLVLIADEENFNDSMNRWTTKQMQSFPYKYPGRFFAGVWEC